MEDAGKQEGIETFFPNMKTVRPYIFGYKYVLGQFNPISFHTTFIVVKNKMPELHEGNHASLCANSLVHRRGSFQPLFEALEEKTDYSVVENFRNVFEGIVRAFCELNPKYAKEESELISTIENVARVKLSTINDTERNEISEGLVKLVTELNPQGQYLPAVLCYPISHALLSCVDSSHNKPYFVQAMNIALNSISRLRNFKNYQELIIKIYDEILKARVPGLEIDSTEMHTVELDALRYFHLALYTSTTTKSSLPLARSLFPILNFLVAGLIFPYTKIYPIEKVTELGILVDAEALKVRNTETWKLKKKKCSMSFFLQELIDGIIQAKYSHTHPTLKALVIPLWDFLTRLEKFWPYSATRCPDCGMPLSIPLKKVSIRVPLLTNLEFYERLFHEAVESFPRWFEDVSLAEASSLLRQFPEYKGKTWQVKRAEEHW